MELHWQRQLGADPKMVADQLGHSVDVSLNVYAQSSVASTLPIVNQLEKRLAVQWCSGLELDVNVVGSKGYAGVIQW